MLIDGYRILKERINMNIFTCLIVLLISSPLFALSNSKLKQELFEKASQGQVSYSYRDARLIMFNEIHLEKDRDGYFIRDVYCEEKLYPFNGKDPSGKIPDPRVINTEHTWPQSKFSSIFDKEVQKTDLHHLYPTASTINSQRSNLPFAEVNDSQEMFCDESDIGSAVSTGTGTYFEPPDSHKGNIARSLFYFSIRYQMPIDPVQEAYLRLWHKEDPIDAKEKTRHEIIFKYQKNRNPFIDNPALVDQILDF